MSPIPGLEMIRNRLRAMRRTALALDVVQWFFLVVGGLLVFGAGVSALAYWWIPSVAIRVGVVMVLAAFIAGTLVWFMIRRSRRSGGLIPYAVDVEHSHPELKNRLVAALELSEQADTNRHRYSPELTGLTVQQAAELSRDVDFRQSLDRRAAKRWGRIAASLALVAIVGGFLFPGLAQKSWDAYSHPTQDFIEDIPYFLEVSPGAAEAIKFDDFDVTASLTGIDRPDDARVHYRSEGGEWRDAAMILSADGVNADQPREFTHRFQQLKRDFEYYVVTGRLTSAIYDVAAVDRPRLTGLRLEYFYPKHTGKAPEVIDENDGTIVAPVGSIVKMSLESNRHLTLAQSVTSDGRTVDWTVRRNTAEIEWTVAGNTTYHVRLVDNAERTNPHPIEYAVTAIPDRTPTVEVLVPGHNVNLNDDMAVSLKIAARDDYGFTKMNLVTTWFSGGRVRGTPEQRIAIDSRGRRGGQWDVVHFWELVGIGMMPSDVIEYYIEVFDNDVITGPKRAASKTYAVRLPSLDEMIAEVEQRYDRGVHDLEDVLRDQREMSDKLQQMRRELLKTDDLNWDRREQIKDLAASQGALEEKLEDLAKSFQETLAEQQQRDLASMSMIQKLAEAQQLFEEVATEEMREQVKKLQEAMAKLDPKEVEKAMEQMEMSQEDLLKSLERTIDYLKRLQAEQKMDAFVQRAKDLKEQQDAINEDVVGSESKDLPEQAPGEDRLKKETEDLLADVAAAEQMLKESKIGTPSEIGEFTEAAKQCKAPSQMQNASQAMQQQNKQNSQSSGESASDELQKMIAQMEQAQQAMQQQQQADVSRELREALDRSLFLSDNQESLHDQTQDIRAGDPRLREMAAEQMALRQASQKLADDLAEISKKSMCLGGKAGGDIGRAMQQMEQAAGALTGRNGPGAANNQRGAMSSLNQLAQGIMEGMDKNSGQCQNPGQCENPGGASAQMESLARRQGGVNSQMPMPGMNGGSMSMEQRQSLSRLRAEQDAIKQGVEGIQKEFGDRRDLLGRLDKLGEDMQRIIEDMEKREVSQSTLDRQRRVFARMLDFQLSLQKQDYKEDRRARAAGDMVRSSPGVLPIGGGLTDEDYERLMTQYRDEAYPREYEETIKNYFQALSEERRR